MENNVIFTFVVYVIFAYSLSNFFVFANGPFRLFDRIRNAAANISDGFGEVFQCMICFPTWVGFGASFCNYVFLPSVCLTPMALVIGYGIMPPWCMIMLDGIITSGIVWLIHTLQEMMERTNNFEDE